MLTFLGALVTFSAFGAAILAFLTAGGSGLDGIAKYWIDHARKEDTTKTRRNPDRWKPDERERIVRQVSGVSIAAIEILSGAGMFACGLWLLVQAENWNWGWGSGVLYWSGVGAFLADAGLITTLSAVAVFLVGILPAVVTPPAAIVTPPENQSEQTNTKAPLYQSWDGGLGDPLFRGPFIPEPVLPRRVIGPAHPH